LEQLEFLTQNELFSSMKNPVNNALVSYKSRRAKQGKRVTFFRSEEEEGDGGSMPSTSMADLEQITFNRTTVTTETFSLTTSRSSDASTSLVNSFEQFCQIKKTETPTGN
jgi:hypothetical protein